MPSALEIVDLNVWGPEGIILSDLSFELPDTGLVGLVGPMGSGKSTLLRFLAGLTARDKLLSHHASARCLGRQLATGNRPALLPQRPREYARSAPESAALARQRTEGLMAMVEQGATVIGVDEPTAGLHEPDARALVELLLDLSKSRLILMATHHLQLLSPDWARVILLGAGQIFADTDAASFLADRSGEHAKHFRRTGGLPVPRRHTRPRDLDPNVRPLPEHLAGAALDIGEQGWLVPLQCWYGRSALPEHGWFAEVDYEIASTGLRRRPHGSAWQPIGCDDDDTIAGVAFSVAEEITAGTSVHLRLLADDDKADRLVGAVLVSLGVAPETAAAALGRSRTGIGMELEQFLWNLDLRYALAAS